MCSVWEGGLEGEEGGRPPSITLPTNVTAVQSVGSGLALLDQVRLSAEGSHQQDFGKVADSLFAGNCRNSSTQ
jgi:hypothetical protein